MREEARILYKTQRYDARYSLERLYGHHNLTSDTEPEEMLMTKRSKVIEIYNPEYDGETLYELFGDKCLPDKSIEEKSKETVDTIKEDIENPIQMPETMIYPKSILNLGDKVRIKGQTKVREVYRILPDGRIMLGDKGNIYSESDLELYIEEPFEMKTLNESLPEAQQIIDENFWDLCESMEEKDYPPYLDRPKKIVPTMEEKELKRSLPPPRPKTKHQDFVDKDTREKRMFFKSLGLCIVFILLIPIASLVDFVIWAFEGDPKLISLLKEKTLYKAFPRR